MAKTEVYKCDRCEKEITGLRLTVHLKAHGVWPLNDFLETDGDLCRDCTAELAKWFGVELEKEKGE